MLMHPRGGIAIGGHIPEDRFMAGTHDQPTEKRHKRARRVILLAIGLMLVAGLVCNYWPVKGHITISRETTYITGPLNEDGTVNYLAALNQQMSKGVTPENNAAPLLIRAFDPALFPEWARQQQLELLGIEYLPQEGDYFVNLDDYLAEAAPQSSAAAALEDMDSQKRQDMLDTLCKTPWSVADHPSIAAWLKANEKPLSLIVQASKRPEYYLPLVSSTDPPQLIDSPVILGPYLSVSRAMAARAMLNLHRGKADAVMADVLALHCLARLLQRGPLVIDKLIAIEVAKCGGEVTIAVGISGELTARDMRRLLDDVTALPPITADIADAIDQTERFANLDCVMALYRGTGPGMGSRPLYSSKYFRAARGAIDWDRILRNFNRWFDRTVDAMREPDPGKRLKAANALKNELERMKPKPVSTTIKLILGTLVGRSSKAVMTDALSNVLISILTPTFSGVPDPRYGAVVRYDLARITLALAAFKAEKGKYPEKLSELSPAYIKKVPADIFAKGPLVYKRDGKGYLLYSVGRNMKDDGGVEDEDTDEDDVAVRVK